MVVNKIIIHNLEKIVGGKSNLIESYALSPNDDRSNKLLSNLLKSYRGSLFYTEFKNAPGNYFPERYDKYINSPKSDQDFIAFSSDCSKNLQSFIDPETLAKGGYLIFVEYQSDNSFVAIFLVRDTEENSFQKINNSYQINNVEIVDTRNLAMAARINETMFGLKMPHYISFSRLKQPDVSGYFTNWLCADNIESGKDFTKTLYQILGKIDPPINPATNKIFSTDELRAAVSNLINANPDKNINIRTLGEQLWDDPNKISDFADEYNISIDTVFNYDKNELRKFTQIHLKKDGFRLSFSKGDKGRVNISETDENVIMIESQQLAEAYRTELRNEEHN